MSRNVHEACCPQHGSGQKTPLVRPCFYTIIYEDMGVLLYVVIICSHHSLTDVGDCVHPAADANLVSNVRRVTELVHDGDVVRIRTLEELTL